MVKEFKGKHGFLSNFYPSPIIYEGIEYPTVEHAYQAAKTNDIETRMKIAKKETPGKAKRAGGKRGIITNFDFDKWETKKNSVMEELVRLKFQDPKLREKLLETGEEPLQEGNNWGDTYWGVNIKTGRGKNILGKTIEKIRDEIKRTSENQP